jgi:antirestriction protein
MDTTQTDPIPTQEQEERAALITEKAESMGIPSAVVAEWVDDYDYDGIEKALELCEEAYSGSFDSDEAFAEDMAEQTGALRGDNVWPYTCIDWEQAARELMYDYTEIDGYYFRQM